MQLVTTEYKVKPEPTIEAHGQRKDFEDERYLYYPRFLIPKIENI